MIRSLHHDIRVKRPKQLERFVFQQLTGVSPEQYVKYSSVAGRQAMITGQEIAKDITVDTALAAIGWTMKRSKRLAVVAAGRSIPYVGWALFAYDVYQLFD